MMVGNYIWWFWIGFFLVAEIFTLLTKEKYYPSLSRWTWRKTALWKVYIRGRRVLPLRIPLFIGLVWLVLHLPFGECAFGVC